MWQDDAEPRARATAEDELSRAVPARPLESGTLRTVFLDLLGRPPFAAERERWLGRGFAELVDGLLGTEEFWRHWLDEQLYYFLLIDNFRPGSERFDAAPADLAAGRLDVRELLHLVALSPKFDLRNPGADTFVTVVMEQFCGIEVQRAKRELEVGKRIYDGARGSFLGELGSSQADLVRIAVHSEEAARTLAAREHERYVHAELDRRTLREWAKRLQREPRDFPELLREALSSEVYAARLERRLPLPNRLFVSCLFVDLQERLPEHAEAEPLREALDGLGDSAPLRAVLARLLLDSGRVELPALAELPDRASFVTDAFRRMLGRDPTQEELAAFLAAMDEPACRTPTVLYAILSHPEYHRY